MAQMNGVIGIYKEQGFTSHDVVGKLRGILKTRQIGHTGTLDPMAEGVLPVCVGNATKACDLLTEKDKTYVATMRLGVETDTLDITGKVLKERPVETDEETVQKVVLSFLGDSFQTPPMYSAIKVGGKKLYEYARQGIEIPRDPRPIHISQLHILHMDLPHVQLEVSCSKGTYIRSLCADIGEALGCGAVMESLLRTRVGQFTVDRCLMLKQVEQACLDGTLMRFVQDVPSLFPDLPRLVVKPALEYRLYNGNVLEPDSFQEGLSGEEREDDRALIYDGRERFQGIYRLESRGVWKPVKMFLQKGNEHHEDLSSI